ncbi:hypothetical protein J6590_034998 [Homalodisca vitripennis]|nr:hypothetical protein J6590_034998 [Homalodisca vitripennis]
MTRGMILRRFQRFKGKLNKDQETRAKQSARGLHGHNLDLVLRSNTAVVISGPSHGMRASRLSASSNRTHGLLNCAACTAPWWYRPTEPDRTAVQQQFDPRDTIIPSWRKAPLQSVLVCDKLCCCHLGNHQNSRVQLFACTMKLTKQWGDLR